MAAPAPSEFQDALPAGTRLGEFEVHKVVGVGGFGIVYRAYDHALQRIVALKEYLPGALAGRGEGYLVSIRSTAHAETFGVGMRSFVNEARLLAQFDHPALLKVYRFWEGNGTAYMVMPFYEGVTLHGTRRGMARPPPEAWMRAMLDPVLGALDVMHREQVFHRDVAPDNIILRPEAGPVLLDFGAARRVIGDRTQMLTAILKPNYAPIEQYAESSQLRQGPWTDLYALGAVVYYCATGKPPMPAATRALHDELVPLPDLVRRGEVPWSEAFAQIWQSTLAVRPTLRPQSVAALRELLAAAPVAPPPASSAQDQLPTVAIPGGLAVSRPSGFSDAAAGAAAARALQATQAASILSPQAFPATVQAVGTLAAQAGGGAQTVPPTGVAPSAPAQPAVTQMPQPTMPTTVPVRRGKYRRLRGRGAAGPAGAGDETASSGISRGWAWVLLVAAPVAFAGVLWWSTVARPGAAPGGAVPGGAAGTAAPAAAAQGTGAALVAAPPAGAASDPQLEDGRPAAEPGAAVLAPATAAAPPDAASGAGLPSLQASASEPVAALDAPLVVVPDAALGAAPAGAAAPAAASQAAAVRRPLVRPRPVNDGALLPNPPAPQAVPVQAMVTEPPAAVPPKPQSPRATCGSRVFVALYRCMERQCSRRELASHPECVEWRRFEENRGRR
jgi:hypothetical protein